MADNSAHPSGMSSFPLASVVRQASYEVLTPAPSLADRSAPSRPGMVPGGEAAGTLNAESDPTSSIFTEKPVASPVRPTKLPVLMKPLGFVVKADGEFAAILSDEDDVYIVQQGDRFAGRYRALSVSADAVEAVEDPRQASAPSALAAPSAFPELFRLRRRQGHPLFSSEDCLGCKSNESGEVSAKVPDDPLVEAESPPPRIQKDEPTHAASAQGAPGEI